MTYELRQVAPLRAANISALVYGVFMGVFSLIAAPFFLLAALVAPSDDFGAAGMGLGVVVVLIYPVLGVVMGWITGLLGSAIYNLIVRLTGGLLLDLHPAAAGPAGTAVPPASLDG